MTAYHRCLTVIGCLVVGAWLLAIALTPFLVPHGPNERLVPFAQPGFVTPEGVSFPFGTDQLGRDVLVRTVTAAGNSLALVGITTLVIYLLGWKIAVRAASDGGLWQRLAGGLVALGGSVPWVITYLVFIAAVGLDPVLLILAFFLASLPGLRHEAMLLRRAMAAPESEQPQRRQALAYFVVVFLKRMAFFIAVAECIAAVGLGPLRLPATTFGGLLWQTQMVMLAFPHVVVYPVAALISLLLGLKLLAAGLEGLLPTALQRVDPARAPWPENRDPTASN